MFPSKDQQAQAHGNKQHVEDPRHIVNVQLTAHDFFLFITADASEPDGLQLLCVTCERGAQNTGLNSICITLAVFLGVIEHPPISFEHHSHGIMKFFQIISTPDKTE